MANLTPVGPAERLTPALVQAACDAIAEGQTPSTALIQAGIPPSTARHWLNLIDRGATKWPDGTPIQQATLTFLAALRERIERAQAAHEASRAVIIAKAARSVNEKTGIPEWRAAAWDLEHNPATKRQWAEYKEQRIEHAGSIDHTLRAVQQLPDADLIEALPEDWRELVPELPAPRDP